MSSKATIFSFFLAAAFLTAATRSYAQSAPRSYAQSAPSTSARSDNPSPVPSANDSVFSPAALHAVSLLDCQTGKPTSLAAGPSAGIPRLFIFLSPECPLCQNYSKILNQLNTRYAGKIAFYGIFPGKAYKPAEIKAFAGKYQIGYPLLIDGSFRLSHYLQASTTPEVILLSPGNELIYKGAIDNWYKSLGKARVRATENYLQDAIDQALRKGSPPIKRTTPVGCLLNDF